MSDIDVYFHAEDVIDEGLIMSYLNTYFTEGCESIDYPLEPAKYFVTVLPYSKGFHTSVMISWKIDETGITNTKDLLISFAKYFNTDVLSELEADKWFLVTPKGSIEQVEIIEHDDGISVSDT